MKSILQRKSNLTMPMNCLIFLCYQHGKTSAQECKKHVSIERKPDELILLFQTDNRHVKQSLNVAKTSDFLFLYRKLTTGDPYHLIFVELKGVNVGDAIGQLKETVVAFRKNVIAKLGTPIPHMLSALVVCSGCEPRAVTKEIKDFKNQAKASLYLKSASKCDLRDLIEGKIPGA